jgi:hypothetical protein
LAARLFGRGVLYRQPRAMAEACAATIGGARRIVVRSGLAAERANFAVARVVGELAVENDGWFRDLDAAERVTFLRDLAAHLVAPPAAVRARVAQVGVVLSTLAAAFTLTETAVAMRIAEVGAVPGVAVVTPLTVYHRGSTLIARLDDANTRALAAKKAPNGVRKAVIRDEPGRIALLARSA